MPMSLQHAIKTTDARPLICQDEVCAILRCSRTHLWRLWKAEKFPAPVKVGTLNRWRKADIDEWIDRKG